ncbi:hypothetical protein [Haloarcula sp. CBA1129]|uniref:hypothetical protein n=1 Tax=Haloarcula sp. CBA1129 TaxID=1853684 RepID=UPI001CDA4051|nr:hypothetical protein [Haloarcula sp. CBA1129]
MRSTADPRRSVRVSWRGRPPARSPCFAAPVVAVRTTDLGQSTAMTAVSSVTAVLGGFVAVQATGAIADTTAGRCCYSLSGSHY